MKKTFRFLVVAVLLAMGTQANAQSILGTLGSVLGSSKSSSSSSSTSTKSSSSTSSTVSSILGGLTGSSSSSSSSSSTTSSVLGSLANVISSKLFATKDQIVGTWTYQKPAILFTSDNVLKKYGSKLVTSSVESKLQAKLTKYGIKPGEMTMTFDSDGNFTQTVAGKTVKGTYTVSDSNVTLKYAGVVKQFVGTTQMDDGDLLIVMDASKLLSLFQTVGKVSGNSTLKSASSLISGFNGMKCGLRLQK